MKNEVSYLPPDKGGAIIKGGRTKLVPETRVEPSQDLAGVMPHSNISRVSVTPWIASLTALVALVIGMPLTLSDASCAARV